MPEHDNVEVPLGEGVVRVILFGEALHVRPVDGEMVADKETVPPRP